MKSQHLRILILLLLVSFIFFFGYKNYKQLSDKSTSPLVLIPSNASLILQINDLEDLIRKLKNSEIWNNCKLANYASSLQSDIQYLDSLVKLVNNTEKSKINTLFFSTHKSSYNDAAILFSTTVSNTTNFKDFIANVLDKNKTEISTHNYENEDILELSIKTKSYFISEKDGVIFVVNPKFWCKMLLGSLGPIVIC